VKIQVVLNARGEIVGTARQAYADIQVSIVPGPKQTVRDLDVPDDLVWLRAEQLHEALAGYLSEPKRKATK